MTGVCLVSKWHLVSSYKSSNFRLCLQQSSASYFVALTLIVHFHQRCKLCAKVVLPLETAPSAALPSSSATYLSSVGTTAFSRHFFPFSSWPMYNNKVHGATVYQKYACFCTSDDQPIFRHTHTKVERQTERDLALRLKVTANGHLDTWQAAQLVALIRQEADGNEWLSAWMDKARFN